MSRDFKLLELFLPEGILDYFEIVNFETVASNQNIYTKILTLHLEEKKIVPEEYLSQKIKACGFMPAREIDDYPIRDMLVKLSIKRRRWEVDIDGKKQKVSRNWNIISKGTRMSEEYSSFLKEISR